MLSTADLYFTFEPCELYDADSMSSLPDFAANFYEEQQRIIEKMDELDSILWLEEVQAREQLCSCKNDEIRLALESFVSDISQQRIIIGTRLEKFTQCRE